MKAENILPQIELWKSKVLAVNTQIDALSSVVGEIDGPLLEAINSLISAYTNLVAVNVGCSQWPNDCDYLTDLDWYRYEVQFGNTPAYAVIDGERVEISDLESLAKLIEATEAELTSFSPAT